MNGPDHYAAAEQLLGFARDVPRGADGEASLFAEAQVHAMLALAAAVATLDLQNSAFTGCATGRTDADAAGWARVLEGRES